jgi:hypothetical protein
MFGRVMDGLDLSNPAFIGSVILAGILLAGLSGVLQMYGSEAKSDEPLNIRAIIRDGILGGIFTAMAWVLVPDTMKGLTSSISSGAVAAATSVVSSTQSGGASATSGLGPELQIGPPRF